MSLPEKHSTFFSAPKREYSAVNQPPNRRGGESQKINKTWQNPFASGRSITTT